MEVLNQIITKINDFMSDYVLLILLVGAGIFFTIRTKCAQVRYFGEGVRNLFKRNTQGKKGISSFGALATAVAAQVGTGNIVGACGAILVGGPGAIFWMWIIAFLGMATIYAEAVLAQKTRVKGEDGIYRGGPVYYIRQAFKGKLGKFLAGFFAVAIILALGFFGATVQANSISSTIANAFKDFGVNATFTIGNTEFNYIMIIVGVVVAAVVGLIIIGGAKRISSVAEKIVPIMAIIYILGGLVVLAMRITVIPETFALIFKAAFNPTAAIGGAFGATIAKAATQGAKRGLFSNEAGMGSTPHAHALAETESAHQQGTVAMVGVFIDTFIVLTMTALVVISTLYTGNGPLANITSADQITLDKTMMAQAAFGSVWTSNVGNIFVAVCLLFFAFTTIIGWNLFGKINVEYLFGKTTKGKKIAVLIYSILSLVMIILGSFMSEGLVWNLTDFFNQFMVLPNMLALIWLSKKVKDEIDDRDWNKKTQKQKRKIDDEGYAPLS